MDYKTIIENYNAFQNKQDPTLGVPLDLKEWKNRMIVTEVNTILNKIPQQKHDLNQIYSESIQIEEIPSTSNENVVLNRRKRDTHANTQALAIPNDIKRLSHPKAYADSENIVLTQEQYEPNYTFIAMKAMIKKVGLLLVPGLLFFILLNDTQISMMKKLIAFAVYYVYSMIVIVSEGLTCTHQAFLQSSSSQ